MSLPPELGAIDEAWGEDEQPTIARPSRVPTARAGIPSEAPTAPGVPLDAPVPDFELELELAENESEANAQERITSIPEIPMDDFARRAMQSDSSAARAGAPPQSKAWRSGRSDHSDDIPTEIPPSEAPTAPPVSDPTSIGRGGHIPPVDQLGVTLNSPAPDAAPPLSEPRTDAAAFSGRFSSAPPNSTAAPQRMKERFAMGDFSGALELAERILQERPNDDQANSLATKCREVLEDMYSSRIAGLHRTPTVVMGPDQLRWLSLDHRAGFLLSMVDGVSTVDDLLDVSGMQRLDALKILCDLLDQKVIALH